MDTKNDKPAAVAAATTAARAIQRDAGTASAVEYLKARDVEASVIERVLAQEVPAPPAPVPAP